MQIIEPLLVVFDAANEIWVGITTQCRALVRAHTHLIIWFGSWVMSPNFWTEFQPSEQYIKHQLDRVREFQAHFESKWKPNAITIVSDNRWDASVMMFYRQQMLKYFSITEEWSMNKLFLEMNRDERRKLGKTIKIPLLPFWVTIKKSPSLVRDYNANIRVLLELQKKSMNA